MDSNLACRMLLIGLAIALLLAAVTDLRRREIDNWLTLGIALAAPVYWFSAGLDSWSMMIQVILALVVFVILIVIYATGAMGGGDVKLLAALALWITPHEFTRVIFVMAIAGGLLSVVCALHHRLDHRIGPASVPYGVAIAFGTLWVLGTTQVSTLALTAW